MTNPIHKKISDLRRNYFKNKTYNLLSDNPIIQMGNEHYEINNNDYFSNDKFINVLEEITYSSSTNNFQTIIDQFGDNIFTLIDEEERQKSKRIQISELLDINRYILNFENELINIFKEWTKEDLDPTDDWEEFEFYQLKLILCLILDEYKMITPYFEKIKALSIDEKFKENTIRLFSNLDKEFDRTIGFDNVKIMCGPNPKEESDLRHFEEILRIDVSKYSFEVEIFNSLNLTNIDCFINEINSRTNVITSSHGKDGAGSFNFKGIDKKTTFSSSEFKEYFSENDFLSTFFCSADAMEEIVKYFSHIVYSETLGSELSEIFLKCYLKGLNCGKSHYDSIQLGQIGLKYRTEGPDLLHYYKDGEPQ